MLMYVTVYIRPNCDEVVPRGTVVGRHTLTLPHRPMLHSRNLLVRLVRWYVKGSEDLFFFQLNQEIIPKFESRNQEWKPTSETGLRGKLN